MSKIWQVIWKDKFVREFFDEEVADGNCAEYLAVVKRTDLNHDGIDELFVEGKGKISAASTTPIWVMQKQGDEYKSLLREQGELYQVRKTRTNGYEDLFFPSRRSVASTFLTIYKFRDGKYQSAGCRVEFYNALKKAENCLNVETRKR